MSLLNIILIQHSFWRRSLQMLINTSLILQLLSTFEITVIACSEIQLVVGSSSIKFNQNLTSPSQPHVTSPLLQSQTHSIIIFCDKFSIYTNIIIYIMSFTFRQNNSKRQCVLLDEHIAWVSLLMTCSRITAKRFRWNYQRHLYIFHQSINISKYLLIY